MGASIVACGVSVAGPELKRITWALVTLPSAACLPSVANARPRPRSRWIYEHIVAAAAPAVDLDVE